MKGYLEGHKTDYNDALAIANAPIQNGIKYSRPKSLEQQAIRSLETSRISYLVVRFPSASH